MRRDRGRWLIALAVVATLLLAYVVLRERGDQTSRASPTGTPGAPVAPAREHDGPVPGGSTESAASLGPGRGPVDPTETGKEDTGAPARAEAGSPVPAYFELCTVRVRERATGKPIVGARLMIVSERLGMQFGGTTDGQGDYSFPLKQLLEDALKRDGREEPVESMRDLPFELRVRVPGCRIAVRQLERAEQSIEVLVDAGSDRLRPGRVEGVISTEDGESFKGRVLIEGYDELGDYSSQWVVADAGGAYVLPSMTPGRWRLRVAGNSGFEAVLVPDGGTIAVNLKAKAPVAGADPAGLAGDARTVRVVGLPLEGAADASVRAEVKPRQFFRATVRRGEAEFEALPVGGYRFVLEVPGQPERAWEATVGGDDATVTIRFEGR